MKVGSNSLGLGRFEHNLVARKHKRSRAKKGLLTGLTLTAMVDMFSVLVIFLLQTFSSSPELMVMADGVVLPNARTSEEIKDAPLLSVSNEGIYLDQELIGETDVVLKNPTQLMVKLKSLRENWQRTYPDKTFEGEINLQADRKIPSTTVSQVMAMLPGQAYSTIHLAVITGSND